ARCWISSRSCRRPDEPMRVSVIRLAAACLALAVVFGGAVLAAAAPPVPAAAKPAATPQKTVATAPVAPKEGCPACHLETGDERLAKPVRAYADDIHRAKGFGCVACHGGDGNETGMEAMDPAKGYIGKPQRAQVAQVCGRCHADARFMKQYNPSLRVDQLAEYATS